MTNPARRAVAASAAVLLTFGGLTACSDEDGDGGVTDEEIQDLEDGAEDVGSAIDQEVDAQDEGDNKDGE